MNEDRMEGAAKKIGGKVEAAAGQLTGNKGTDIEGRYRQAEGAVQNMAGQAQDMLGDAAQNATAMASDTAARMQKSVTENPVQGLLIAAGVGFMLGWLMRSSAGH